MRIALVAPLFQTVPPTGYGGTERVLNFLIEELINLGHTVTLYTVGGSGTDAHRIETVPCPLRQLGVSLSIKNGQLDETSIRPYFNAQLHAVLANVADYDIIHIHHETYPLHGDFFESLPEDVRHLPILWTDHVNLHVSEKYKIFEKLARADVRLTTLSHSHHELEPRVPYIATVYNGIPERLLMPVSPPAPNQPGYLAFLGRLSPEKGAPAAIRIARDAGMRLRMAGPMSIFWQEYATDLKRLIADNNVDYIGEIGDAEKSEFLSAAAAVVFPIQWEEPFGLVMIEAMACGTPIVAFRRGSVPEIVDDGVTGFIVDTEAEAVQRLKDVGRLDRAKIRKAFERRFTAKVMAKGYVDVYERICNEDRVKEFQGLADVEERVQVVVDAAEMVSEQATASTAPTVKV